MTNVLATQDPLAKRNKRIRELLKTGQDVKIDYQGRVVNTDALSPVAQSNLMTIPSGVLA